MSFVSIKLFTVTDAHGRKIWFQYQLALNFSLVLLGIIIRLRNWKFLNNGSLVLLQDSEASVHAASVTKEQLAMGVRTNGIT